MDAETIELAIDQFIDEKEREAHEAFIITAVDGLFSVGAKKVGGCRCWRFLFRHLVRRFIPCFLSGDSVPRNFLQARAYRFFDRRKATTEDVTAPRAIEAAWRRAVDLYVLFALVILSVCYGVALCVSPFYPEIPPHGWVLFAVILLPCVWRFMELCSVFVQLHLQGGYSPHDPARPILNTLVHYLELTVIFATVYVLLAHHTTESFGAKGGALANDAITPLYYSLVTIITLGYGNYAPQQALGKLVVMAEVVSGLFVIVVVLQRAIGASLSQKAKRPTTGRKGGARYMRRPIKRSRQDR